MYTIGQMDSRVCSKVVFTTLFKPNFADKNYQQKKKKVNLAIESFFLET